MDALQTQLQKGYVEYGSSGDFGRKEQLNRFFAIVEDGSLGWYLTKIDNTKKYYLDIVQELLSILSDERQRDGDFRFMVNFFLRGSEYDDEPFSRLVNQVNEFFM